jgi:c-di-GMP phosphodiesterase
MAREHFNREFKKEGLRWERSLSFKLNILLSGGVFLLSFLLLFIQHSYFQKIPAVTALPFTRWIFTSVIFTSAILVVFNISLNKFIMKPIHYLNKAIKALADQNFHSQARVLSADEIGILSRNFNKMVKNIQVFQEYFIKEVRTDLLTGLPNRQQILIDIEKAETPTLILMNIDFFKEINDCYGNKVGDFVLIEIANRVKVFQEELGFHLYKMPADEYALFFDRDMDKRDLERIVKILDLEINEKPFIWEDNEIHVRVTCGAARGLDIKQLGEGKWRNLATSADMALKKAKRMLRGLIIYDESMEIPKEYENNILWKQKIKEALKNNNILPYFQPIVNNRTGKIEKYESLVRLIDARGNIIAPHYFLDIAKKSHCYCEITKVMIDKSFAVFENKEYEFSVNLTMYDILDEEMNGYIKKKIKENQGTARRLVFEILESEGIENYKEVMLFIEEVKEFNCKIAIDDFGSGYSNFDHILKLDVDYIKIDSSLIKNIDKDSNAQIITKTISNFSKELGLKTISEYVHSEEVFQKGIQLGIDYSQGFYFGEPQEYLLTN